MDGALVTLLDERQLRGTVERFDTALPDFVIRDHRAEQVRVQFADVRKVGFVGESASPLGESVTDRLVTVRIVGGESICGLLTLYEGQRRGFHLVPTETSIVARWYVPMQAIRDVIPGRATGRGLFAFEPCRSPAGQRGMSGKRIGDILLDLGFVSQEQLGAAVQVQRAMPGMRLGELMIAMGFTNDKTIGVAMALQCDLPFVSIAVHAIDPGLRNEIPATLARRWGVLPLAREHGRLQVAVADPTRLEFKHELRARTGMIVREAVAATADLERATELFYGEDTEVRSSSTRRPSAIAAL